VHGAGEDALARGPEALGEVQRAEVRPERALHAHVEDARVGEARAERRLEDVGLGGAALPPRRRRCAEERARAVRRRLARERRRLGERAPRGGAAEALEPALVRGGRAARVRRIEGDVADPELDPRERERIRREGARLLEPAGRLGEASAEAEHVAEPLGDPPPEVRPRARGRRAALGDRVVALGRLEGEARPRLLGRGEGVRERARRLPGAVEVVGALERARGPPLLESQRRAEVQAAPVLLAEALEERLADAVVDEGAAPIARVEADEVAAPGHVEDRARLPGPAARERRDVLERELAPEHGRHAQRAEHLRREPLDAPREDDPGAPRGRRVGERARDRRPAALARGERPRLDEPLERGAREEGVPRGEAVDGVDGLIREGPRHGLEEEPEVGPRERRERDAGGGADAPERVAGGHLLGAEGGDDRRVPARGARLAALGREAGEELRGEVVGPLAVVEEDERGAARRAERARERGEGRERAGLAERLGAGRGGGRRPEDAREVGEDRGERGGALPEARAHLARELRLYRGPRATPASVSKGAPAPPSLAPPRRTAHPRRAASRAASSRTRDFPAPESASRSVTPPRPARAASTAPRRRESSEARPTNEGSVSVARRSLRPATSGGSASPRSRAAAISSRSHAAARALW
jgi:hypothetical protein